MFLLLTKRAFGAAAAVCLLISVIISMVKMLHEMGIVVFEFWLSESREENVVRWKAEAKRKAKTARMKKQRELHIRKILEDNADYEGVFDEVLNPADDDGGGSTADSLAVEDCDERAAQKIESSVRPVVECGEPAEEEERFFVATTGLRKQGLVQVSVKKRAFDNGMLFYVDCTVYSHVYSFLTSTSLCRVILPTLFYSLLLFKNE